MREITDLSPRLFEEVQPGMIFRSPGLTLTEDAIIRFAMEWDFQPIHVDRIASEQSMFRGLTASGLHTFMLTLRLCNGLWSGTSVGLGFDELRFVRPVRPEMTISVKVTITGCRPSQSQPDFGVVNWLIESQDQTGETVLSMKLSNLLRRRGAVGSLNL